MTLATGNIGENAWWMVLQEVAHYYDGYYLYHAGNGTWHYTGALMYPDVFTIEAPNGTTGD
jgi:hypothetical protein